MMLLLSLCYFQLSVTWFLTFHERIIAMQLTFRLQNGTQRTRWAWKEWADASF